MHLSWYNGENSLDISELGHKLISANTNLGTYMYIFKYGQRLTILIADISF